MNKIASIKLRILAAFCDILIYLLFYELLLYLVTSAVTIPAILNGLLVLGITATIIYPLAIPLLNIILISSYGGTPGKLITGLEIVDERGKKISLVKAFFRNYVGYVISTSAFFLGFIWIAVDKQRQGWHDMIAGTKVVVRDKSTQLYAAVAIAMLLAVNIVMILNITRNLQKNSGLYSEMINNIQSLLNEAPLEMFMPSPTPPPIIDRV